MQQVIFLDWSNYKPKLWCRNKNNEESIIDISAGKKLSYELGECKCIGPDYGTPCPHNSQDGPQCEACAPLGTYPCVICNGTQCLLPKKRMKCEKTEYTIYLTSFGEIVKVGVSQRARLMQRWLEQGAQYACELKKVNGGLLARKLENLIGKTNGVKMAVHHTHKRSNNADKEFFENKLAEVIKKFAWLSKKPQIYDLTQFYPELPDSKPVVTDLKGVSKGVRGHLLVLNDQIINLKKLVGWELRKLNKSP